MADLGRVRGNIKHLVSRVPGRTPIRGERGRKGRCAKSYPYVHLGENLWTSSRGDVYKEHLNSKGKFAGLRAVKLTKQDKTWRKAA